MSLISQYIDALNDSIRTGHREADPIQKASYLQWQADQQLEDALVQDLADKIQALARAAKTNEERDAILSELNREVARIGEGCPTLTL